MAILEIHERTAITTYEDSGLGGISLGARETPDGWVALYFGTTMLAEFPGREDARDRAIAEYESMRESVNELLDLPVEQAISVVGEAEEWSTVTLNGNCIWISEALRAAREELRKQREAEKERKRQEREAKKSET